MPSVFFVALTVIVAHAPLDLAFADRTERSPTVEGTSSPASVYRISWPIDAAVTVAGAAAVVVPYALSSELITPRCPCDPREVNAFDRPAIGNHNEFMGRASDVTLGLAWLAPLVADAFELGWSTQLVEDAVVFAEVVAVNGALVTGAKYLVQRPLPRTYAGELLSSPGGYRSFYSGHTSNAVAALTFMAMTMRLRHGEKWWPWVVTLVVGTSVGIERVLAGRHFPTDVLVGGLAGGAVGIAVPWLHARRSPAGGPSVWPIRGGAQAGWAWHW